MDDQVETDANSLPSASSQNGNGLKPKPVNRILGDCPRLPIRGDFEFTALLNGGFTRRKQWQFVLWSGEQGLRQQRSFFRRARDAGIKRFPADLLLAFFRPVLPTGGALLEREALIDRRFEVINSGDFNFCGNAVFARANLFIDVGPAAAIIEFKMDLQAAVRIARGAFIPGFVARENEGVAGGGGIVRCGSSSDLAMGQSTATSEREEDTAFS